MLKKICAIFLIIAMVVVCCSCGNKAGRVFGNKDDEHSESLSIFSYKPDTFCPILSNNQANLSMLDIIYDGLIYLSDEYVPMPNLAESWTVSSDGLCWTFYLRKAIKWHDGTTLSADDAEYTINQIKKYQESAYLYNVSNIAKAESVGDSQLKITLSKPNSNFANLLYFPIIKKGEEEIDAVGYKPNGTGPYMFEDRNEGNVYYLVANENWWGGSVKTKTIQVKMLPGGDTPLYAFGSGSIDVVAPENMDWGKFVDAKNTAYADIKTPKYNFLGINHDRKILSMTEVRRAISLVISRDDLVEETCLGYGVKANSPVRPEWFVCKNQKFDLKKDSDAAKRVMEEAGWTFENNVYQKEEDGVKYTAEFEILINEENTLRENVSRKIAGSLEEFGIKVNVQRVSYEEYSKRIAQGNFDTFLGSMAISPDLNFSHILGEGNMFAFEDEEMSYVMKNMMNKTTQDETKLAYDEFINLFEQNNPIIGLFFENSVMLYSKRVKGEMDGSYFDLYSGIEAWQKAEVK